MARRKRCPAGQHRAKRGAHRGSCVSGSLSGTRRRRRKRR